jgi:trehalose-6-phosphatase
VTHRKDLYEEQAIRLLAEVVQISERDRDALPGSAVKHVKAAITIMRKRRKDDTRERKKDLLG